MHIILDEPRSLGMEEEGGQGFQKAMGGRAMVLVQLKTLLWWKLHRATHTQMSAYAAQAVTLIS